MEATTPTGNSGFLLIAVFIMVVILSVVMMTAVPVLETETQREREEELIFRGKQYVLGIELYMKKHTNLYPQNLEILHLEKCIRQLYPDPMSEDGKWYLVFQMTGQSKQKLTLVPESEGSKYIGRGVLIGVCSTSADIGFREYRGRKRYDEWAFYLGANEEEDMPELEIGGER